MSHEIDLTKSIKLGGFFALGRTFVDLEELMEEDLVPHPAWMQWYHSGGYDKIRATDIIVGEDRVQWRVVSYFLNYDGNLLKLAEVVVRRRSEYHAWRLHSQGRMDLLAPGEAIDEQFVLFGLSDKPYHTDLIRVFESGHRPTPWVDKFLLPS